MSMKSGFTKSRAFTLVETMVVVGIVIALAAILIPVAMRARGSGYERVSASNLRQLGAAMHLYAGDSDGALPPHTNVEAILSLFISGSSQIGPLPTDSDAPMLLRQSLQAYVRNDDVWFCPVDPVKRQDRYYLGLRHEYTSYLYTPPYYPNMLEHVRAHGAPPPFRPLDLMPSWMALLAEPAASGNEEDNESALTWLDQEHRGYHASGRQYILFADLSVRAFQVGRRYKVGELVDERP